MDPSAGPFRWTLPLDPPCGEPPSAGQPSAGQPSAGPPTAGPPFPGPPFPWTALPLDRPSPGPPFPWTALPPDRPKFRSFLPSLGVFSLNFGGVLEGRNHEMCTFGLSDCRVKPRRPHQTRPPGLAHDSPRTPNVHISRPRRFKNHQNSTQGPQERERRKKIVAGKGKKKRGPPPFGAPQFGASTLRGLHPSGPPRGPTFSGFGPPPFRATTLWGPPLCGPKIQHPKIGRSRNWPKSKLAEVEIGRSRNWPNSKKAGRSRSRSFSGATWNPLKASPPQTLQLGHSGCHSLLRAF